MYGYHGRYLRIDCSRRSSQMVELAPCLLRRYLGGVGLGTLLALAEGAAEADPLGPGNAVVFAFSPLVGSPLTTSAKFALITKSPLTERLNDALVSSGFAVAGKACGVDALVVTGQCPEPVLVTVDDGEVAFHDAGPLWELPIPELEDRLRRRFPAGFRWAVIGPAGCRHVRFATVSHDGRHAGRGGTGAVLGAKRVLAVGVRGTQRCRWAHSERLIALARDLAARSLGPATSKYREIGTIANLVALNRLGALPARNFQESGWEAAEHFSPERFWQRHHQRASCVACTIGCEHRFVVEEGGSDASRATRLEYETLFALGPLCGIDDPQAVMQAARRCDESGIDTISAGGTIALAMECVACGLLDLPWLRFGDAAALLRALEWLERRHDWGFWLGEGSRRLAERIGGDAPRRAMHVKGLELPGYDPRSLQTFAVGLAVAARGADHNRTGAYEVDLSERVDRFQLTPEQARLACQSENQSALLDSLILCKFLRGVFTDLWHDAARMLELVTGWDISADELRATIDRIITLKKVFNMHCGWRAEEDVLPERLFGPSGINRQAFLAAVEAYYQHRGWNPEGVPGCDQLAEIEADVSQVRGYLLSAR
ncbi:MAG: aldehyde ferredoxin oxidoreductase [Pirellulaceae bacterium]|nr:MAG: aldehyde ferredoxin oxidoreductase [Pirellulaceae bacterium]